MKMFSAAVLARAAIVSSVHPVGGKPEGEDVQVAAFRMTMFRAVVPWVTVVWP